MIYKEKPISAGTVFQEMPDVTPSALSYYYNTTVADGDFLTFNRGANGQHFVELSIDPLASTEAQSVVEFNENVKLPLYTEIEAAVSQRIKGQYAVVELTDKDTTLVDVPTEVGIVSLSQSNTTLTAVTNIAFDGYLGSWVDIYGLADNRFNYTNLAVATISADKKTLTFNTSDEATLPSLTASPASVVGGFIKRQAKLLNASNAAAMRFSGVSATTAAYLGRYGGGSIKEVGTLTGSRLATSASSATQYVSGATGNVELKATSRFRFDLEPESLTFTDKSIDSSVVTATRAFFSGVKPANDKDYYIRFRAVNPKSTSYPVAKIVSIVKTGTTTATVTTASAHGLSTTSYVTIKGVRDVTNYPNTTTPTVVASIVSPTSFTIVTGSAVTATSYGGAIIMCNGQVDQQGLLAQTIQSVARDINGLVTLVGNTTWVGYGGIGEYVTLYGVRDIATGADLGFDGVYRVNNAATTTLILEPVKDLFGNYVVNGKGVNVTPTGGVVVTTNAGGTVILRTTLRNFDIMLGSYSQQVTKVLGQGTVRQDLAIPTYSVGGTYVANTTETALLAPSLGLVTTAATTNATSVKASAGTLYSVTISNTSAAVIYVKLYNLAVSPTVGTSVPIMTIPVAASSFLTFELGRVGTRFSTGIALAATGALVSTDTTAIAANCYITLSYI